MKAENLGTDIFVRRNKLGLNREQLAVRAGVHSSTVANAENDASKVNLRTLGQIYTGLDCEVFFEIKEVRK